MSDLTWCKEPPNQALQRAAIGIKCAAAGDRASCFPQRWRARVLQGQRAVAELGSYAATAPRMPLWVAAVIIVCAASTPSRAEDLVAVVDLTFVESTDIPSDVICAEGEAEDCIVWGTLKIYRAKITRVVAGVESRKSVLVLLGSHSIPARSIKNRVVKMRAIPAAKTSEPQYHIVDLGTKRELYCFKDRGGGDDGYLLDAGSEQASRCYEDGVVDP